MLSMLLSSDGMMYTDETIRSNINTYLAGADVTAEQKKSLNLAFHYISNVKSNMNDQDYWKIGNKVVNSIKEIVPKLNDSSNTPSSNFVTSAVLVRSPYLSPSVRGVDSIDFFLNYTPPIVANQLVPYLDVEFKLTSTSKEFLNVPSPMRFLLGTQAKSNLNAYDKILAEGDSASNVTTKTTNKDGTVSQKELYSSVMGMEMFMMPQSLTNMDGLEPVTGIRLAKAKPFLPFASLLGMDISINNAGAGKFSHKKATLKLRLHDKARIAEFADFIKGSSGYNHTVIWTTYGWLSPLNMGDTYEYGKFINDTMMVRECWTVANSQFSFDQTGQVNFNLELLSKAASTLLDIPVITTVHQNLMDFHKIIQQLRRIRGDIDESKFSINVSSAKVLNEATSTGMISDIKDVQTIINNLQAGLNNSAVDPTDAKNLSDNLGKLVGKKSAYTADKVKTMIATAVHDDFVSLNNGDDPFLPTLERAGVFGEEFANTILQFNKTADARNKALKAEKGRIPIDMRGIPSVVSFGKLFLHFIAPALKNSNKCDELQVIFYGLNGECGPASMHSIAEFPINMTALAYAYAEKLKQMNVEVLSIHDFLKLIIDSNFADQRGIGYGMTSFFKPLSSDSKPAERADDAASEKGMIAWQAKYGGWRPPMIEMFVEAGEEGVSTKQVTNNLKSGASRLQDQRNDAKANGGDKRLIKRIHIYDKQHNPYKLEQQIIDAGDSYVVGSVNTNLAAATFTKILEGKPKKLNFLKQQLNAEKTNYKLALEKYARETNTQINPSDLYDLEEIKRPDGDIIKIPKDPRELKKFLMRGMPCIVPGTNGSMIINVNVSSKTEGLMAASNIFNAAKANNSTTAAATATNLEGAGGLPLRVVPVQLTMSTMGVPIANLYQTFFVDFGTNTSLDNIYSCNQIQHSITPGKFTTSWTFMYVGGYGKFGNPPTVQSVLTKELSATAERLTPPEKAPERARP